MNRREFFHHSAKAALAAVYIRYLFPSNTWASSLPGQAYMDDPRLGGKQLYEGRVKVTGGKIYAADFRARDLPGWPVIESRSLVLRTHIVDRLYKGLNASGLKQHLGRLNIVTGDELHDWGCRGAPPFLMPTFYVRSETCPSYFGQPVALLSFPSTDDFLANKSKLTQLQAFLEFGQACSPVSKPDYGKSLFVFYQGTGDEPEFSYMQADRHQNSGNNLATENARYLEKISEDLSKADWLRLQGKYQTQSVDPMFMEPENGLSWYDSATRTLHLTLGTQSPHEDAISISHFFEKSTLPRIDQIVINCCFIGGGFGGKDSSDFPIHLAIAALTQPDISHRIAYNRQEQFQAGLKRHAAESEIELAVDSSGKFQYLRSSMQLDGGGQNNYSFAIQSVGARNAAGAYRFARSQIDSIALASTSIPAGSMRGFGSFQSSFGLECLIDEVAQLLDLDPVDLRLQNLIKGNGRTQTGVKLAIPTQAHDVLLTAKRSERWERRNALKEQKSDKNYAYGTGFAAAYKTFGKHENGCLACVELTEEGKVRLYTPCVDMGNGSATTLSLSLGEVLGRPADEVQIGVTNYFDALKLVSSQAQSEAEQESLAKNPFWTPSIVISSAASTSAYHLRHAVLEAAKLLRDLGLLPAVAKLMNMPVTSLRVEDIKFETEGLRVRNGLFIPFLDVARTIWQQKLVTGVMVHAYYRQYWAEAEFPFGNKAQRLSIDALSVRHGGSAYTSIPRSAVHYSPLASLDGDANRMSSYAAIVSVMVDRNTGEVHVNGADGFLDCGPPIVEEIVQGQMNGAFAMGVGQALTESLSLGELFAGQGDWNLHLYHVPTAKQCAVGSTRFQILTAKQDQPRGMSEVVFNPIPSAIVNAIADATGHRFRTLPVKPTDIIKALSR
jgi:CO/xanthine dehydrogenase Mo-binding subunit